MKINRNSSNLITINGIVLIGDRIAPIIISIGLLLFLSELFFLKDDYLIDLM